MVSWRRCRARTRPSHQRTHLLETVVEPHGPVGLGANLVQLLRHGRKHRRVEELPDVRHPQQQRAGARNEGDCGPAALGGSGQATGDDALQTTKKTARRCNSNNSTCGERRQNSDKQQPTATATSVRLGVAGGRRNAPRSSTKNCTALKPARGTKATRPTRKSRQEKAAGGRGCGAVAAEAVAVAAVAGVSVVGGGVAAAGGAAAARGCRLRSVASPSAEGAGVIGDMAARPPSSPASMARWARR